MQNIQHSNNKHLFYLYLTFCRKIFSPYPEIVAFPFAQRFRTHCILLSYFCCHLRRQQQRQRRKAIRHRRLLHTPRIRWGKHTCSSLTVWVAVVGHGRKPSANLRSQLKLVIISAVIVIVVTSGVCRTLFVNQVFVWHFKYVLFLHTSPKDEENEAGGKTMNKNFFVVQVLHWFHW